MSFAEPSGARPRNRSSPTARDASSASSPVSGQKLFLTARMTDAGRIHRITLDRFRHLMADDPEISDIVLRASPISADYPRSHPGR
jgi:hypothetical protein